MKDVTCMDMRRMGNKVTRVRRLLCHSVRGHPTDSYNKLQSLALALVAADRDTVVELATHEDSHSRRTFEYIFVCPGWSVRAAPFLRKQLSVDGAFMKHG